MLETTHACTIDPSPNGVWPWIVQMGYYRAGWYTDPDWWDYWPDRYLRWVSREEAENTGNAHRDAPSADRILPELQNLAAGDVILDGPPGTAYFTVAALEPHRLLALHSTAHLRFLFPAEVRENPRWGIAGEFSWAFVLREMEGGKTRLILRTRGNAAPPLYRYFVAAFLPLADWALARKMLRGIKRRAEGQLT
jgi:hypothetical protein